ncbi:stalk domain-containing protein [Paenibacillus validus]|uniref:stalk domain-containing protein n=1 Tax=Paenibacillus validus TaxID=44253 RepID=UPI003D2DE31C
MFRKSIAFLLFALALITAASAVHAEGDDIKVYLHGKLQSYEQPPLIKDGSTMVPMRAIFETLGATVKWDGENQIIDALKGTTSIRLQIGWKGAYIGQDKIDLDIAPEIINGSTMVPLRFIGEALGEKIEWDGDTRSVLISTDKSVLPKPYQDSGTYTYVADELRSVLPQVTETQLELPDASHSVLTSYADLFFASDRHKGSLRGKATPITSGQVEKNPGSYSDSIVEISSIHIIDISEKTLENGEILTIAYGYTGGEVNQITEKWVDPTYYQILYVGSADVQKGDKTEVNGVVAGESTIGLVNNDTGNQFSAPVYPIIAGNFYNFFDLYLLLLEEAQNSEWVPDAETKDRLNIINTEYAGENGIVFAARDGQLEVVKALLASGISPETREPLYSQTALMKATSNNHLEVIKALIEAGADLDAKDKSGESALIFAYKPETLKLLLDAGANPNVSDNFNESVLFDRVRAEQTELVKLLLRANADPNVPLRQGGSLLGYASQLDNLEVFELLLDAGAKLDPDDPTSYPHFEDVLIMGATSGNPKIVKIALEKGADPNFKYPFDMGRGITEEISILEYVLKPGVKYNIGYEADEIIQLLKNASEK